jgi:hypothetical protein
LTDWLMDCTLRFRGRRRRVSREARPEASMFGPLQFSQFDPSFDRLFAPMKRLVDGARSNLRGLLTRRRQLQHLQSEVDRLRKQNRQLKSKTRKAASNGKDDTEQPVRRPPVGGVRFGDLRRLSPISRNFGMNRGQPIDRYFIEKFLTRHAEDIGGRVLEIKDATYTRRFGGDRVSVSDVLDVADDNPHATIVADLTRAEHVPSDTFDCIILTQTLHFIYDVRASIATLCRILKPGGVLLATFPGISQTSCREHGEYYCWALSKLSARRLFEEVFPAQNIEVSADGNVLAAIAFLHGLAAEELRHEELDSQSPDYEVLITLRAIRPDNSSARE